MHEIDLQKLIGSADLSALPESLAKFMQALLEGRVAEYALAVILTDGTVMDCFPAPDGERDVYRMIGALEMLKRDYMRVLAQSRVEYAEVGND